MVENINKSLAQHLGGDHCHNIDRIMRLPGTINWPNAKKKEAGRVPVLATIIDEYTYYSRSYALRVFDKLLSHSVATNRQKISLGHVTPTSLDETGIPPDHPVTELITHGRSETASKKILKRYKSRSEIVYAVIFQLARAKIPSELIAGILMNPDYEISAKVLEQNDPLRYCEREIKSVLDKLADEWPDMTRSGKPIKSLPNALMTCMKLGIKFEFDAFHNRKRIADHQLQEYQGDISDDAAAFLRKLIIDQFGFDPGKQHLLDAITILCVENRFHPILDYLNSVTWDWTKRLDTFFIDYFGAEDTALNRAAGKIMLTAAVRRVKEPGCKYDLMVVLEGKQGTGKSTALLILAGEENFSDQSLFALRDKEQMEAFEGVWIFEVAELDGMSGAEVSRIKALITRRADQARPAYARFKETWQRQSILVGTTNDDQYLKDQTGNRRFIPVATNEIDLKALKRDRDQIWAEAAKLEAEGFPIYLSKELEIEAGKATDARMLPEPWLDALQNISGHVSDGIEKVATQTLFNADNININTGQLKGFHYKKASKIMRSLGWEGPKQMWIDGKKVRGYSRPTDKPDTQY